MSLHVSRHSHVVIPLLEQVQYEGALLTQVLCDACLFDAGSLTWRLKEPTPFARCAHTAVALPSGGLLCLPHLPYALVALKALLHMPSVRYVVTV